MIEKCVGTRSATQVRSHAQKYDLKTSKCKKSPSPEITFSQQESHSVNAELNGNHVIGKSRNENKNPSLSLYEPLSEEIQGAIAKQSMAQFESNNTTNQTDDMKCLDAARIMRRKLLSPQALVLEKIKDLQGCVDAINKRIEEMKDLRNADREYVELQILVLYLSSLNHSPELSNYPPYNSIS